MTIKKLGILACVVCALTLSPVLVGSANAGQIYFSAPFLGGGPYNYVPLAADSTPNRPAGTSLGNTITFGAGERNLTTVYLGLFNGGGSGFFTLDLYSGGDPNTGTWLGSASGSIGGGIYPTVLFDFTSQGIVLPDTITFIVSDGGDSGHGPLSGVVPAIGTAPNSMWFGSGPGSYTQNSTWAIADGASTNLITAEFDAVPDGGATLALLGGALMGLGLLRRKFRG